MHLHLRGTASELGRRHGNGGFGVQFRPLRDASADVALAPRAAARRSAGSRPSSVRA